jgi:hypothetical protein
VKDEIVAGFEWVTEEGVFYEELLRKGSARALETRIDVVCE